MERRLEARWHFWSVFPAEEFQKAYYEVLSFNVFTHQQGQPAAA